MRKRIWSLAAFGAAALAGIASAVHSNDGDRRPAPSTLAEAEVRDLDIGFYARRVARDSTSARDLGELARLHLQRARESGDQADLERAEGYARRSLALRTGWNGAAAMALAATLLAQHRFDEAREVAARLVAADSFSIAARALLGETQLELGRYEEAARTFGRLAIYRGDPGVAPRLARWAELRGRPEEARRLLRLARDEAWRRHGVPAEQRAWFQLRLGDFALRHGRLDEAERELRAGLSVAPEDYRLLAAMARLEMARRHWARAIDLGERAIARTLDPATLGLLSDAYAAQGDTGRAEEYARAMEVAVSGQAGPFHRAWSLFLLDHGRSVPEVLAKAREELEIRQDVYGYDLLAWALYRQGRSAEADAAATRALALGTRDASLFFHAGMIARARGDHARARRHLEAALAANPAWHPTQPEVARAALKAMDR